MPRIIDADSHTVEPPDLWEKNLEPEFRHRAMRIAVDEDGLEYLEIDGKKPTGYLISGGMFGRPSGIGKDVRDLLTPGKITYQEGLEPGAVDSMERLKVLDSEGIEASVLYPTMGLAWEAECPDYKLAAAYCRVYNDWVLDFCRHNPDRLIPIAHISVSDAVEGATELERTAKLGARGVFLSGYPINGVSYGDPRHDRFWSIAQGVGPARVPPHRRHPPTGLQQSIHRRSPREHLVELPHPRQRHLYRLRQPLQRRRFR